MIDDWYDDGRIDGTYALHCYDDAIEILPRDVRDYSSAKEDIERALQAKLRGERATARDDRSLPEHGGRTRTHPVTTPPTRLREETRRQDSAARKHRPRVGESASSVPLPLLILAGLALLLVAGGSAGYLIRRFQSRQLPPPPANAVPRRSGPVHYKGDFGHSKRLSGFRPTLGLTSPVRSEARRKPTCERRT